MGWCCAGFAGRGWLCGVFWGWVFGVFCGLGSLLLRGLCGIGFVCGLVWVWLLFWGLVGRFEIWFGVFGSVGSWDGFGRFAFGLCYGRFG